MPISYENPWDNPLYDPPKYDKAPKIGAPQGPPPDASAGAEAFLNPDGTLKQEYLDPILEQISGSPYFQALAGEQPDLSGYAQTGDVQFGNSSNDKYNIRRAGTGASEYPDLKSEFSSIPHERGTLSMAR